MPMMDVEFNTNVVRAASALLGYCTSGFFKLVRDETST